MASFFFNNCHVWAQMKRNYIRNDKNFNFNDFSLPQLNPPPVYETNYNTESPIILQDILKSAEKSIEDESTIACYAVLRPFQRDEESLPQFERVPSFNMEKIVQNFKKPSKLEILEIPITCPITKCQKLIYAPQFAQHIYEIHTNVPVEVLAPGHYKDFSFNLNSQRLGMNNCRILYLIKDKIDDNSSRFSKYLPVVLMSTIVGIGQIYNEDWNESYEPKILLIWLTGIFPENSDIFFTLAIHSTESVEVKSGKLYNAKMGQSFKEIWDNGMAIYTMLPEDEFIET